MRKIVKDTAEAFFNRVNLVNNPSYQNDVERIEQLRDAPLSGGRDLLIAHFMGVKLTRAEAMLAFCCDCMGFYKDGRVDCENPSCPHYSWMPYRKDRK